MYKAKEKRWKNKIQKTFNKEEKETSVKKRIDEIIILFKKEITQ